MKNRLNIVIIILLTILIASNITFIYSMIDNKLNLERNMSKWGIKSINSWLNPTVRCNQQLKTLEVKCSNDDKWLPLKSEIKNCKGV